MSDTLAGRKGSNRGKAATEDAVSAWFIREVVPLEALLMRFLRRNWRNESDIADLRQEVYARTFDAAREHIPDDARRFLMATARNLIIDRVRHEQIVPIEAVADIEALEVPTDAAGPDRVAQARDELRRLQEALDRLPPVEREAILLTYVEDLKLREIAARMGVAKSTASVRLSNALRALVDQLYGSSPDGGKS